MTAKTSIRDVTSHLTQRQVIITGDTHLGHAISSPQQVDSTGMNAFTAFEHLVEYAINEDVDAVFHLGDLFDNHDIDTAAIEWVQERFRTLASNDIGVGFICGNHDPTERMHDFDQLNGILHLGDGVERHMGDLSIVGYDNDELKSLGEVDESTLTSATIMLAHPEETSERAEVRAFQRERTGDCAVFIGHRHQWEGFEERGPPTVVRPGTISSVTYTEKCSCARLTLWDDLIIEQRKVTPERIA